tara:strand:+ start:28 stop:510 length:483 start_codon:yes stop_codon:yes gene_type:complete
MKKNNFLSKLKQEEKLELVEPSEEVCESYLEKSANCLKSAKLLLQNNLYENSIGMSYYSMYNLLIALLFRVGIKCENHAGSFLLLKLLFDKEDLFKSISDAKKERIDKQYYVTTEKDEMTKESAQELLNHAEDFIVKMKLIVKNLNNEYIDEVREKLDDF